MPYDIADRVVVVTGTGRGLGQAIALGPAPDGARVAKLTVDQDPDMTYPWSNSTPYERCSPSISSGISRRPSTSRLGQPEDVAFLCCDAAQHLSRTLLPLRPVTG